MIWIPIIPGNLLLLLLLLGMIPLLLLLVVVVAERLRSRGPCGWQRILQGY